MKDLANEALFFKLISENIKREGIDKLVEWIKKSDFFVAPASTKFHSAYEGGLLDHCINTYFRLIKLLEMEYGETWENKISKESATIIALFHDLCKIDFYKTEMRNVKEDGVWVQKPYYTVDDKLPYGHGEKSVYIINGFIRLTREEAMAINWHSGGFDPRIQMGSVRLENAFYEYPISVLFHMADIMATYLDESMPN